MCFSMGASFVAGAVLSTVGIVTLKKTSEPSQIIFASIPLVFAIQQISEGFLWLALSDSNYSFLENTTTYLFLIFAQVVWPIWVPIGTFLLEKDEKRKNILKVLVVLGILISLFLAYCLCAYPVEAKIMGQHISYIQHYPRQFIYFGGAAYILTTTFPPLFSSLKGMKMLSLAVFISYLITEFFYENYIVSVWCFFASVISIAVLAIMIKIPKK